MERAEAEAVYDAGREACVEFLVELTARYERQVTRLEARIERLEEKLRESSENSSRPPSADPPSKDRAESRPSIRKQGGQPGHEGTTRKLVAEDQVDEVIDHWPVNCSGRGRDLDRGLLVGDPHRHQVTELPPTAVTVSEHRAHSVRCPDCGKSARAALPAEVASSAFGPRLQAAIALLSVRNRISRRDASELCGSSSAPRSRPARSTRSASEPPLPSQRLTQSCARRSRTPRCSGWMRPAGAAPGRSAPSGARSPSAMPPCTSPPTATSASCPS